MAETRNTVVLVDGRQKPLNEVDLAPCREAWEGWNCDCQRQALGLLAGRSGTTISMCRSFLGGQRVPYWPGRRIVAALGLEFEAVARPASA